MNNLVFSKQDNDKWAKKLPGKMTSACLIIIRQNKALIVKANYKDHWTFPSGIADDNESPLDAAIRETKEETSIAVSKSQCSHFCTIFTYSDGDSRDRFNFAFIAQSLPDTLQIRCSGNEISSYSWVRLNEIAKKSKYKGSYLILQDLLTNRISGRYFEVR